MQFSRIAAALSSVVLLSAPVATDALTLGRGAAQRAATGSPVERVVVLLKDMQEKLAIDEKEEQKIYDKYACWCEKTTARKAGMINDASAEVRAFGQIILSLKGFSATRASEIAELEAGIKANQEAQAQATSIRSKENAEYTAETAELKQAIAALEKAVTVLVGGTGASALLQESTKAQVRVLISDMPVSRSLKSNQVALLHEFLQSGGSTKYMPQSFTVQGILKDMYETFVTDLETATQAEGTANKNFEDFIAEKTVELKDMQADKAKKESEKAEAEQRLADTQGMYDDTAAQHEADVAFFDETKAACQTKHEEWTTRSSLRDEELEGISKALEILTSDEARELFSSAIKEGKETGADNKYKTGRDIAPVFLQLDGADSPMSKAFSVLKNSATKGKSLRLAALAVQVREAKVGHFEKVLMMIDSVITTLRREEADDIEKRDQCKDQYKEIESTVKDVDWKIEKNVAKIDKLTKLIELRTEQKEKTIEEIQETEAHMAAITAEKKAENQAFLKAKEEDQQSIDLLMSARHALSKFYAKHEIEMGDVQGAAKAVFAQQAPEFGVSEDQAPDAVFSNKGHRKGESKGIVSILTMIIEDLNDEIKNGMKGEEVAQLDYEQQMATAQKLHDELVAKKLSLENAIAKRSEERGDETADKEANEKDLQGEHDYKKNITPDCDWIIGAFHKRADARKAEMEGLAGAKEFLAGAETEGSALLATKQSGSFDDKALSKVAFLGLRR